MPSAMVPISTYASDQNSVPALSAFVVAHRVRVGSTSACIWSQHAFGSGLGQQPSPSDAVTAPWNASVLCALASGGFAAGVPASAESDEQVCRVSCSKVA